MLFQPIPHLALAKRAVRWLSLFSPLYPAVAVMVFVLKRECERVCDKLVTY